MRNIQLYFLTSIKLFKFQLTRHFLVSRALYKDVYVIEDDSFMDVRCCVLLNLVYSKTA
jgi:hypothetical protein